LATNFFPRRFVFDVGNSAFAA
jgi:hypothetical protein